MKKNITSGTRKWYFSALVAASVFGLVVLVTNDSYGKMSGDKTLVRTVTTKTEYNKPRPGCTTTTTTVSIDCSSGHDDCTPIPATTGDPVENCPD